MDRAISETVELQYTTMFWNVIHMVSSLTRRRTTTADARVVLGQLGDVQVQAVTLSLLELLGKRPL